MAKRGSENRQKTRSILVRLGEREYCQLTECAAREGASRAEYMRRRVGNFAEAGGNDPGGSNALTDTDKILLAGLTRSMGHLAGLMKLAVLKSPPAGPTVSVRSILDAHHRELQDLQGQIRALLERTS